MLIKLGAYEPQNLIPSPIHIKHPIERAGPNDVEIHEKTSPWFRGRGPITRNAWSSSTRSLRATWICSWKTYPTW